MIYIEPNPGQLVKIKKQIIQADRINENFYSINYKDLNKGEILICFRRFHLFTPHSNDKIFFFEFLSKDGIKRANCRFLIKSYIEIIS